ncbi:hypothetical protein [Verminephrobacter aporrectodeae]|uniref:hypothetical protein n=1 Tax=Verminephrobacter aporrectodeae TaxID=1110389 RepID=UPI00224450FF|nr:hypothetical protein [Verminephrobacter aporrectodeae]
MNIDLEMLVARLRWPLAATRWWSMQELAVLLRSPVAQTQVEVSERLLVELTHCRLEAEVVELLCIFWMANKQGFVVPPGLAAAVNRPSLLSALLLGDMGLNLRTYPTPPLQTVCKEFDIPVEFYDLHGTAVPRIYLTRLQKLEECIKQPFVSQFAYEWSKTGMVYPEAQIQGGQDYFVRPVGGGLIGGFSSRTMLRMVTAYQRTLEVAKFLWSVPDEIIHPYVIDALPVDPTLTFLHPSRPPWLPPLGQEITADSVSIEAFVESTVSALSTAQPDLVLLALVTPTYVTNNEIVELSIVRWRQWGIAPIDADKLTAHFYHGQEYGEYGICQASEWGPRTYVPMSKLNDAMDAETNAAPMAAVYGIHRFGYLQTDLYPSRLYYPLVTGLDGDLVVEPMDGVLKVSALDRQIATMCYWNAGWYPIHPSSAGGLCGTALLGVSDSIPANGEALPDRYFYLWKVTRLKREAHDCFQKDESLCGVLWQ